MKENNGERAIKGFLRAYMAERKLHKAVAYLDKNIQWIGTGAAEHSCTYQETVAALQEELLTEPWPYDYQFQAFQATQVDEKNQLFFILLTAASRSPEFDSSPILVRITAACHWTEDGWKIVSIHFSTPNLQQEDGEYYPRGWKKDSKKSFSRNMRGSFVDILNRSVSGGIIGCYLEPGLPVYYINQNMLDYLGYEYGEFEKATGNLIVNCIDPGDWAQMEHIIDTAMKENKEYAVRYRMRKRDGSYIWVSDIGKKSWDEKGVPICIGVVRDITDEVVMKRRLEQESLQRQRQAEEYSHIFNSVFCGIVQYRMDRQGGVKFEKANLEAIRIFGYTPEEFWTKENWDLSNLIVEEDRTKTLKAALSLEKPGQVSQFEYRLRQKNGAPLWVIGTAEVIQISSSEGVLIQSVFLDIQKQKMMELKNKELLTLNEGNNELLRLALNNTSIYEFYYYPKGFRVMYPKRTGDYFGLPETMNNVPRYLIRHMAAESRTALVKMCREVRRGAKRATVELQEKNGRWSRITLSAIQENNHNIPTVMVGLVENITKQKEMELVLERARSLDSITGLYNKDAGLKKVRSFLEQKPKTQVSAMMILDLDDFQKLNDEEGRMFGDAILAEVADILKSSVGPEDILVRLGGDEFMLLIKNCSKQRANELGPSIAQKIKEICYHQEKDLHVSASIGMCVTSVIDEYNGLYRCAESTLQYVKKHGKGKAACYLDVSSELGTMLTQVYTGEHLLNEVVSGSTADKRNLADMALEFLSKAKHLDDAISLLLAKVGKAYRLDRVSMVEIERDYHSFHYSYQWAKNKHDLQMGNTYYIKPGRMEELSQEYDADGLCDWKFHEDSPMASCLRCAIWNSGVYTGHLVLESHEKNYLWTEAQRKTLQELTQIISTFVAKAHADAVSLAKTQFLSRMSHEIRTPMNAIAGMTTIAKTSLDHREKVLDCLNKIERSNQYLLGLINDILEVSRIESGKIEISPEWVDMVTVERQLNEMFASQAKAKNITLLFQRQYEEKYVFYLDTLRFNQIFINLIGNAIKFTRPGGTVIGRARLESFEKDIAYIRFSIEDTGIGIAPEAIERIFDSFEQGNAKTAQEYGGTGLGLTISSHLVQLMGGKLEVKSRLGEGSEFYFTLPLKFKYRTFGQTVLGEKKIENVSMDWKGKRLLVAEDNKLNMEIAVTLLEMEGFQLETVQNGKAALELYLKKEPYYFDAILMDIQMPIMNGLEATKAIRLSQKKDARTIPIIAMTANAFDEDARESIQYGMNGHLSKPFTMDRLLEVLSECL